jgi:hypothetical protein
MLIADNSCRCGRRVKMSGLGVYNCALREALIGTMMKTPLRVCARNSRRAAVRPRSRHKKSDAGSSSRRIGIGLALAFQVRPCQLASAAARMVARLGRARLCTMST